MPKSELKLNCQKTLQLSEVCPMIILEVIEKRDKTCMYMGRAANKKAETEQSIYEAGMNLFKEKGFANTTMQDISERAGIAKSTIFNYFTSKEEIVLKFGRSQVAMLKEFVKTLPTDMDTKAKILAVLLEDISGVQESNEFARIQLTEVNKSDWIYTLEAQNRMELASAVYAKILCVGQEKGEICSCYDCNYVAGLIVAIYFHALYTGIELNTEIDIRDYLTKSVEIIWHGICQSEAKIKTN